jgi:hypothetical protein
LVGGRWKCEGVIESSPIAEAILLYTTDREDGYT